MAAVPSAVKVGASVSKRGPPMLACPRSRAWRTAFLLPWGCSSNVLLPRVASTLSVLTARKGNTSPGPRESANSF
eukprot:203932-Prorocentrum_lima.AAC.1